MVRLFDFLRQALVLFLFFAPAFSLVAHNSVQGLSGLRVIISPEKTEVQWAVSFLDVDTFQQLDKNSDDLISDAELQTNLDQLKLVPSRDFQIWIDDELVSATNVTSKLQDNNFEVQWVYAKSPRASLKIRASHLQKLPVEHREYLTVVDENEQLLAEQISSVDNPDFVLNFQPRKIESLAHSTNAVAQNSMSGNGTFGLFILRGIKHILIGYDHLLFLFALLVMCEKFREIIKIITCFTLAHSMTLGLAALNLVEMPSRIVEPLIAATIVYVGIENLLRLKTLKWRWLLTFSFGLIHGFGFASVLREMGIGSGTSVWLPLLSFNLGVEIGQIFIAALILPLLWNLRKIPNFVPRWIPATSILVVALGSYWLVQRVWFTS